MTHDVTAILAMDPHGIIGYNGGIPWHYPEDLKRFKQVTQGGALIMGRKTLESLPEPKKGIVLPGRLVIVVTTDPSKITSTRPDQVVTSVEAAFASVPEHCKPWIIGGSAIYEYAAEHNLVDVWDVTDVPSHGISPTDSEATVLGSWTRAVTSPHIPNVSRTVLCKDESGNEIVNRVVWSTRKVVREWVRILLSKGEQSDEAKAFRAKFDPGFITSRLLRQRQGIW